MIITGLSFLAALAAAGYAVLQLAQPRRGRIQYSIAAVCCALTAVEIFDSLTLLMPDSLTLWRKAALIAESLLPGLFLVHSYIYSRDEKRFRFAAHAGFALSAVLPAVVVMQPPAFFAYSPDFQAERVLFLTTPGFLLAVSMLVLFVWSLVNLETTYRAAPRAERWRIRYHVLGAGALLAVLCFYYSHGLLYRSISLHLVPLRSLFILIAVACMLWSDMRSREQVRLQVSSQMAYRSAVIMAVGAYLVFLGLLGEGMKYLGGAQQRLVVTALMFLSGMGLLLLLLSERVRRQARVFIARHFYANKYDYRIEWQKFTDRLSVAQSKEALEQTILLAFAETFGMSGAALFLRKPDSDAYASVARYEWKEPLMSFAPESSLVRHLAETRRVLNAAESEEPLHEYGSFFSDNRIAFLVPLTSQDTLAGFIMLRSRLDESEPVTFEDYDLMKALAQHACSALLTRTMAEELAESRELAAVAKLSTFVIHDLKNQVSGLSLVVQNAADFLDDPDFRQDMVRSVSGTVKRMQDLIARLNDLREKRHLKLAPVDLTGLSSEITKLLKTDRLSVEGSAVVAEADREEIGKVILNLVINAVESSDDGSHVRVETGAMDGQAFVRVHDRGAGMSAEFIRNHLFRPFHTTKKQGLGIGLYQCRQIVEAHGGRIDVESRQGEGSAFTVLLPLCTK
ncbi:MAG: integral membrane sensor signal transduction histidine kinase [Nitrospirae bacterium]|nr:MAG: integral membrane sensor signal transduction histidine kinase [Nitrospirota bacterium]